MSSLVPWPALRISALYALFAGLWIVFSDQALDLLVRDRATYALMQTYKGWFFVAVTAGLLCVVLRREVLQARAERARLRAQVAERDVLLSEMHHRVRNNLQTAVGLVEIVSSQIREHTDRARLGECARSIRAMALVHEALGRGEDAGLVDMRRYLESLGAEVLDAFDGQAQGVGLHVDGPALELDAERAMPLGLIVTELLTNSMKHAFGEGGGTVRLTLGREDGALVLGVDDDGVGLPGEVLSGEGGSMGMEIVRRLAAQAGATLGFEPGPGTRVRLRLPVEP